MQENLIIFLIFSPSLSFSILKWCKHLNGFNIEQRNAVVECSWHFDIIMIYYQTEHYVHWGNWSSNSSKLHRPRVQFSVSKSARHWVRLYKTQKKWKREIFVLFMIMKNCLSRTHYNSTHNFSVSPFTILLKISVLNFWCKNQMRQ